MMTRDRDAVTKTNKMPTPLEREGFILRTNRRKNQNTFKVH